MKNDSTLQNLSNFENNLTSEEKAVLKSVLSCSVAGGAETVKDGLKTNKEIKLGICGEHGGDPKSIDFFHNIGLDYVSCSPYRVPIARLAAAQARIKK